MRPTRCALLLPAALLLLAPTTLAAQAPAISSLSPGSGPLGTSVTVAGSNLGSLTSVLVGGVPAVFARQSAGQATFTVPRQAVSQRVRVSSAAGTALSAATFQVTRPSTSLVLPLVGDLTTDGASVLSTVAYANPTTTDVDNDGLLDLLIGDVNGNVLRYEQTTAGSSAFAGGTRLTTDGTTALKVSAYATPTVTDVDGDGLLDLLVGNNNNTLRRYEQSPPPTPTLTALSPASGPLGTTLTVDGTNLAGLTGVRLGGVPAAFTAISSTRFTAVVPRGAVSQAVSATTADGTALSAAAFQVTRPSPSIVLPALGNLTTGGTTYGGAWPPPR